MTDDEGRFVVPAIAEGRLRFEFSELAEKTPVLPHIPPQLIVTGGHTRLIDVPLEKPILVRGTILTEDTRLPVAGARIIVSCAATPESTVCVTDAQGRYEARVLEGLIHAVVPTLPPEVRSHYATTYFGWRKPVVVPANVKQFDLPPIELTPNRTVEGLLFDQNAEPVVDAVVRKSDEFWHGGTRTDKEGHFSIQVPQESPWRWNQPGPDEYEVRIDGARFRATVVQPSPLILTIDLSSPIDGPQRQDAKTDNAKPRSQKVGPAWFWSDVKPAKPRPTEPAHHSATRPPVAPNIAKPAPTPASKPPVQSNLTSQSKPAPQPKPETTAPPAATGEKYVEGLTISAVDSVTKRPIPNFRVTWGTMMPAPSSAQKSVLWFRQVDESQHGIYTIPWIRRFRDFVLRIQADGYRPLSYEPIKQDSGSVRVILPMVSDPGIKGRVLQPDGKPAVGATVSRLLVGQTRILDSGQFYLQHSAMIAKKGGGHTPLVGDTTDADGCFRLPAETEPIACVLVTHDSGVIELSNSEFEKRPEITLQRWGRIVGQLTSDGLPVPNAPLKLLSDFQSTTRQDFARCVCGSQLATDDKGRFIFEKVPPGHVEIWRPLHLWEARPQNPNGIGIFTIEFVANVGPGETTNVDLRAKPNQSAASMLFAKALARTSNPSDTDKHQTNDCWPIGDRQIVASVDGQPIYAFEIFERWSTDPVQIGGMSLSAQDALKLAVFRNSEPQTPLTYVSMREYRDLQEAVIRLHLKDYIRTWLLSRAMLSTLDPQRRRQVDESISVMFDSYIERLKRDMKLEGHSALDVALRRQGTSLAGLYLQFANSVLADEYLRSNLKIAPVQPSDVRKYYDEHLADFGVRKTVKWQVLEANFGTHGGRQQARTVMNQALAVLQQQEEFGQVVRNYSDGPNAQNGGIRPWTDPADVGDPQTAGFLRELKPGETSPLFETDDAYCLVRVIQRKSPQRSFEEVKDWIRQQLEAQARETAKARLIDEAWAKAKIESPYLASRSSR